MWYCFVTEALSLPTPKTAAKNPHNKHWIKNQN